MILFTANRKNNKRKSGSMKNYEAGLSPGEFARHIKGCALNSRKSQKKIYNSFYRHAMVICDSYAASNEEAVEILIEGFLKIFKQIINYSPACANEMTSFLSWLQTIMAHIAINHHKSKDDTIRELSNEVYYCHDLIENKLEESLRGMNELKKII
jgi:DNA-directed RNA polymerase specialized sigma24 family protein